MAETSRVEPRPAWVVGEGVRDAARPVSLSAIYEEFAAALYRYALALLGRREEAEDVVHDVFVGLMKRGGTAKIRNTSGYLFKAVRRRALEVRRQRSAEREQSSGAAMWWVDMAACKRPDEELAMDVERAMARLPP